MWPPVPACSEVLVDGWPGQAMTVKWRAVSRHHRDSSRRCSGTTRYSLAGRALQTGIWSLQTVSIRDFATDHTALSMTRRSAVGRDGAAPDVVRGNRIGHDDRPLVFMTPRSRRLTHGRGATQRRPVSSCCAVVEDRSVSSTRTAWRSQHRRLCCIRWGTSALLLDAVVRLLPGVRVRGERR